MLRSWSRLVLGVLVSIALATACGSEDAKKRSPAAEAGAAGETTMEPAAGGSSANAGEPGAANAGLAGATEPALGGNGGAPPVSDAGAGGFGASAGAGGEGPVTCCQPKTCADFPDVVCAYVDDGCGNADLYCGCEQGKVCGEGNTCVDCPYQPSEACEQESYLCGETIDSCGRPVTCPDNCSSQSSGSFCVDGRCKSCKWQCESYECGIMDDWCGGTIDCTGNTCEGPATCQPSGVCCEADGLDPCAEMECGVAIDNCGSPVVCTDTCDAATEACIYDRCEESRCKPSGFDCGSLFLGGEGDYEYCGACEEGEACVDNVCVALCTEALLE
jgi:hypothetical protein